MDLGSLRAQVDVLSTDKAMLEERLETTAARLAEAQTTLNSATRDLAGLQVGGRSHRSISQNIGTVWTFY